MNDVQAWDAIEVARVGGADGIAKFHRASSDNEIGERKVDSLGGLLGTNTGDDLGSGLRHWVDRDCGLQFVEE